MHRWAKCNRQTGHGGGVAPGAVCHSCHRCRCRRRRVPPSTRCKRGPPATPPCYASSLSLPTRPKPTLPRAQEPSRPTCSRRQTARPRGSSWEVVCCPATAVCSKPLLPLLLAPVEGACPKGLMFRHRASLGPWLALGPRAAFGLQRRFAGVNDRLLEPTAADLRGYTTVVLRALQGTQEAVMCGVRSARRMGQRGGVVLLAMRCLDARPSQPRSCQLDCRWLYV
jgi:hypothetical protein